MNVFDTTQYGIRLDLVKGYVVKDLILEIKTLDGSMDKSIQYENIEELESARLKLVRGLNFL